jgi:hypothetical protein
MVAHLAQVNVARLRFPLDSPAMREFMAALWWVPAGHEPTPAEALARLRYIGTYGAMIVHISATVAYAAAQAAVAYPIRRCDVAGAVAVVVMPPRSPAPGARRA